MGVGASCAARVHRQDRCVGDGDEDGAARRSGRVRSSAYPSRRWPDERARHPGALARRPRRRRPARASPRSPPATSGRSRSSRATSAAGWCPTTRTTSRPPTDAFACSGAIVATAAVARAADRGRRDERAAARRASSSSSWRATHDVLPVAIVLDVPESVARRAQRAPRRTATSVRTSSRRQHDQLRRSLRGLEREGFRTVHVLSGVEAIDVRSDRARRSCATTVRDRPDRSTSSATCTAACRELDDAARRGSATRSRVTTRARRSTPRTPTGARPCSSATSSTAAPTARACCGWSWG